MGNLGWIDVTMSGSIRDGDAAEIWDVQTGTFQTAQIVGISGLARPANGQLLVQGTQTGLHLKDTSATGNAAFNDIRGFDDVDTELWRVGLVDTGTNDVRLRTSTLNGNVELFPNGSGNVLVDGGILPVTDVTENVGSPDFAWANGFFANLKDEADNLRWDLSGDMTMSGNILFDADATLDIGDATNTPAFGYFFNLRDEAGTTRWDLSANMTMSGNILFDENATQDIGDATNTPAFIYTHNVRDESGNTVFDTSAAGVDYTQNATIVEDRTLLASASATTINNNNVLAAMITDLIAIGIFT